MVAADDPRNLTEKPTVGITYWAITHASLQMSSSKAQPTHCMPCWRARRDLASRERRVPRVLGYTSGSLRSPAQ